MTFGKQYSRFLKVITNLLKRKQKINKKVRRILEEELNSIIEGNRSTIEIKNDQMYETAIEDFSYLHYRWR
jgi:uncharacterized membrane-anchored protein